VESQLIKYSPHPNLNQESSDIQNSPEILFGYYMKNDPVGTISYESETINVITICRLIVKFSHSRKGIAGKLITAIEKRVAGIEIIYVRTAKDNFPAIKRYKKSGFHLIDT